MTTTRRAAQLDPRPFGLAAAAAALVLASGIIVAALGSIGFGNGQAQVSPYVTASARLWELQRVQQSPYITQAMKSAHEWEKQRLQQSPFNPA